MSGSWGTRGLSPAAHRLRPLFAPPRPRLLRGGDRCLRALRCWALQGFPSFPFFSGAPAVSRALRVAGTAPAALTGVATLPPPAPGSVPAGAQGPQGRGEGGLQAGHLHTRASRVPAAAPSVLRSLLSKLTPP